MRGAMLRTIVRRYHVSSTSAALGSAVVGAAESMLSVSSGHHDVAHEVSVDHSPHAQVCLDDVAHHCQTDLHAHHHDAQQANALSSYPSALCFQDADKRTSASTLSSSWLTPSSHDTVSLGTSPSESANPMQRTAIAQDAPNSLHELQQQSSSAPLHTSSHAGMQTRRPIMAKARQIRLAAERLRALQREDVPAASSFLAGTRPHTAAAAAADAQVRTAVMQSQQAQQLRHEEGLIEASLQRLRAERALATVRHTYSEELKQFQKGIARHETAVLHGDANSNSNSSDDSAREAVGKRPETKLSLPAAAAKQNGADTAAETEAQAVNEDVATHTRRTARRNTTLTRCARTATRAKASHTPNTDSNAKSNAKAACARERRVRGNEGEKNVQSVKQRRGRVTATKRTMPISATSKHRAAMSAAKPMRSAAMTRGRPSKLIQALRKEADLLSKRQKDKTGRRSAGGRGSCRTVGPTCAQTSPRGRPAKKR